MDMEDKEIVDQLLARGWKWGYVFGHGDDEPAGDGDMVIADLEKTKVLIAPSDLMEKPISQKEYFGW